METSWLGLGKLARLSERYRSLRDLQQFLGDVLEGERQLLAPQIDSEQKTAEPFSVRDDVESIVLKSDRKSLIEKFRGERKVDEAFAQLAPFFEAGFVLERRGHQGGVALRGMFLMGRVYFATNCESPTVDIGFPAHVFASKGVMRGRVRPVLEAFGLETMHSLREATAFTFVPESNVVYVLICNRPHPWQVGILEKTYHVIRELFGKQPAA